MRALLLVPLLAACTGGDVADPQTWRLVWSDEFDGPEGSSPDPSKWTFDIGTGNNGWGNQELQYYTDRPQNVDLDGGGFLRIRARREPWEGSDYTSARIKTEGLFATTYGRIEARILLPEGRGLWPAFWSLGTDFSEVGWPACGEIDILEMRGDDPFTILGTVHGPGYAGGEGVGDETDLEVSAADAFHRYAIDWDPENIVWSVDGEVFNTMHPGKVTGPWVFDHDFFLILNLAVGGALVGDPDATTDFPATMGVDYVRVYERTEPLADPSAP